ncbi:MAG: hypothetical protein IJ567_07330 [Lachnospiraceae bacterium]|nr:hypothetical protein [Lachnospiraceae bacterium]
MKRCEHFAHADWAKEWLTRHDTVNAENIHKIVQNEIAAVFSHVLADAGVYKRTPEGSKAFARFTDTFRKRP